MALALKKFKLQYIYAHRLFLGSLNTYVICFKEN